MELIETHDGDRVTTSMVVNEDELQLLRAAIRSHQLRVVNDGVSEGKEDIEIKADIATIGRLEARLRTAQVRVIKKRLK